MTKLTVAFLNFAKSALKQYAFTTHTIVHYKTRRFIKFGLIGKRHLWRTHPSVRPSETHLPVLPSLSHIKSATKLFDFYKIRYVELSQSFRAYGTFLKMGLVGVTLS
jgi:hypothetical protein